MNVQEKKPHSLKISSGLWPNEEQKLLLKAALFEGSQTLEAWRAWKLRVDIDHLDHGSFLLLPLLYKRLSFLGVDDASIKILKGVYRSTWYKNQLLLENIAKPIQALSSASVDMILLLGTPLIWLYYKDNGVRPIADVHVRFHPEQIGKAIKVLGNIGWLLKTDSFNNYIINKTDFLFRKSDILSNSACNKIKKNQSVPLYGIYKKLDDPFWENTIPIQFKGIPVRVMNPTDFLIHIFVHGVIWKSPLDFKWITDAYTIIKNKDTEIDWSRIMKQTQQKQLVLPVKNALIYLQEELNSPIPNNVIRSLKDMPVSSVQIKEFETFTKPVGFIGSFREKWYQYIRFSQTIDPASKPNAIKYLEYLRDIWELDHFRQSPFALMKRGIKNIFRFR